ncbi:MAG: ankyrin repeat domain-containing protein [Actinomycetota bacterium]
MAVVEAIHTGDVSMLKRLLAENPGLASARLGDDDPSGTSRTLLHVATDWPGHFPNGSATVAALVAAGADVNARFRGPHGETPLHWAASSDDLDVLDALIHAGADIEADGAVIGGGTPLADARGFGQWRAAHRLVERGAKTTLTDAATLGLIERVESYFAETPRASEDVNHAFWGACHGGQRRCAEYLLDRGADLNWIPPWENLTPIDAAERSDAAELVRWLRGRGAKSASENTAVSGDHHEVRRPRKRRHIELLLGWLDALRRRDLGALAAVLDPDIVWQGLQKDLICRGPEEVVAAFIAQRDKDYEIDSVELIGGSDHVVLGVRAPGLREIAGLEVGGEIYNVFTVAGSKVTRIADYLERNEALTAAGVAGTMPEEE